MSLFHRKSSSRLSFSKGDEQLTVVRNQLQEIIPDSRSENVQSARSSCSSVDASEFAVYDSCVLRNFPKHKSSHLRFLAWVAYTRKYSDGSITDDERRTCPLLWCRTVFENQESMLQHVWNCPHLSKGLYWCFHCQKPERVGKFQCRRCQGAPSKTERMASVAKKIFSKLGTKNHRAHSHLSHISENSSSNYSSVASSSANEKSRMGWTQEEVHELPNTSAFAEMAADYSAASHELPDTYISEMTGTEVPMKSGSGDVWEDNFYAATLEEWDEIALTAPKARGISPKLARLDTSFATTSQTSLGFHPVIAGPSTNFEEAPLSPTIISPLSATGGFDYSTLDISPTDTETSNHSLFSDSGYSSATSTSLNSAWDYSVTSLQSYPSIKDKKGKGRAVEQGPISEEWGNEIFSARPICQPPVTVMTATQSNTALVVHSASSCSAKTSRLETAHWKDPAGIVQCFSEVLDTHLKHTKSALKVSSNSITTELLSMSRTSMVSIGLEVLAGILEGRNPTSIIQIFAFTHVAFALAIAVDGDEAKVNTKEWFEDSVAWVQNVSSAFQRSLYLQIARRVWQPIDLDDGSGTSEINTSSRRNLLLSGCKHFLDVFESLVHAERTSSTPAPNNAFNVPQTTFEQKAKSQVIDELIQKLSIEAFIEDVVHVQSRLRRGEITNARELELELISAGKISSQSPTTYARFLRHVHTLCTPLYHTSNLSRTAYHIRDISIIKRLLPEEIYIDEPLQSHQSQGIATEDLLDLDLNKFPQMGEMEHLMSGVNDLLGLDFNMLSAEPQFQSFDSSTNVTPNPQTTFYGPPPPPSMPRLQDSHPNAHHQSSNSFHHSPPQSHTHQSQSQSPFNIPQPPRQPSHSPHQLSPHQPPPHSHPSPQHSPAQPPTPHAKAQTTLTCHCGYTPTGIEKYKASNLRRHKRIQHAAEAKEWRCRVKGCKSTFTRSDNLSSHLKLKHWGEKVKGTRDVASGDEEEDEEEEEDNDDDNEGENAGKEHGGRENTTGSKRSRQSGTGGGGGKRRRTMK